MRIGFDKLSLNSISFPGPVQPHRLLVKSLSSEPSPEDRSPEAPQRLVSDPGPDHNGEEIAKLRPLKRPPGPKPQGINGASPIVSQRSVAFGMLALNYGS